MELKPRYVVFGSYVIVFIEFFFLLISWELICCFCCGSYHIAGSMGVFYAREPYLNADSNHVTRFLGLAQVGNKNKQVCSLIIPVTIAWYLSILVNRCWFLSV